MTNRDIYLNLGQLNAEVIALNNQKSKDIEQAMRRACSAVSRLTLRGWEGESKEAFVSNFAEHKQEMQAFTLNLKGFNDQLKNILKNGKQLNAQSSKISSKL
jgi:WXG100 family type VII secretion target